MSTLRRTETTIAHATSLRGLAQVAQEAVAEREEHGSTEELQPRDAMPMMIDEDDRPVDHPGVSAKHGHASQCF